MLIFSLQWILCFTIFWSEAELLDPKSGAASATAATTSSEEETHDHTKWSPVVDKKRLCPEKDHEIAFHYSHNIDRHTRVLMINETKVQSSEDCAKLCFEFHCDVSRSPCFFLNLSFGLNL